MAGGQGFYIQRVKKYTLQASDIATLTTAASEVDMIHINKY